MLRSTHRMPFCLLLGLLILECIMFVQFYTKTGICKFGASCKFHHPKDIVIPSSGQANGMGNEEAFKNGSVMQPIALPASLHNSKGLPVRPVMHMNI